MYGLGAIRGVGEGAIDNIVETRKQGGPFCNLFDFCQRVDMRKMNRRTLEALIKAGAFDVLGKHRAMLMASLNAALQQAEQSQQNAAFGQHDLLAMHAPVSTTADYINAAPWDDATQLLGEKETLGFYLTGHPLNRYAKELAKFTTDKIIALHPGEHTHVTAAGLISNVRTRQTKRGDRIAIFTLDDGTGHIEVICFSEAFNKYRELITDDQAVIIYGELSMDDFSNKPRLSARELYTIDAAREKHAKYLQISISAEKSFNVEHLKKVLMGYLGGNCPVVLNYRQQDAEARIKLGKRWMIKPCDQLLASIRQELLLEDTEVVY